MKILDVVILLLSVVNAQRCYKGWRGSDCSEPCPATCVDGHCLLGNGSCMWGCNPDNCINDICDTATGTCTQGCTIGRRGNYCDRQCSLGSYGYNCNQSCDGCLSDSCDNEDGVCTNTTGCKPGRQHVDPWKCDIECSLGYYGFNCIQSCNGCLADACDKENGTCNNTSECKPGWQHGHPKCDKVCESGTFGINCSEKCHCVNQPCNKSTGTCPAGGCQRGYKENTCSTECSSGNYGFNCDKSCDGCLSNSCDREFGFCTNTSGCKPGRLSNGTHERLECDTDNSAYGEINYMHQVTSNIKSAML